MKSKLNHRGAGEEEKRDLFEEERARDLQLYQKLVRKIKRMQKGHKYSNKSSLINE